MEDVANRLWTPEEEQPPRVYPSQRAPVCLVRQGGLRGRVLLARRGGRFGKVSFAGILDVVPGGRGIVSYSE